MARRPKPAEEEPGGFPKWFLMTIAGFFMLVWGVVTVFAVLAGGISLADLLPLHGVMGLLIGALFGFGAGLGRRSGGPHD